MHEYDEVCWNSGNMQCKSVRIFVIILSNKFQFIVICVVTALTPVFADSNREAFEKTSENGVVLCRQKFKKNKNI